MLINSILAALSLCVFPHVADVSDTLDVARVSVERYVSLSRTSPLQSVNRTAMDRSGAAELNEVLRTFAGVSIRDYGGIGGLKTVSVRNLGAQHTAVCYDGIGISDAQNGQIDISRFTLGNLSEASVEIGVSDEIFRSARLLSSAGVLSLNTLRPQFRVRDDSGSIAQSSVSASMRFASFGTYRPELTYGRRLAPGWTTSIFADYLHSDGVYPFRLVNGNQVTKEKRLNSDVGTLNTELNVFGDMGKAGELQAKFRYYASERGLPGSVIYYSQDPTERLWDRDFSASARYKVGLTPKLRLLQILAYAYSHNRYLNTSAYYDEPEDDRYTQREFASSTVLEYRISQELRLTLAEDLWTNHLDASIPECRYPSRLSSVSAFSSQWKCSHLTLTGSLSLHSIRETVRTGEAAPDRLRLSPSLSASWRFLENWRLRASYRDGFRVPTFNDLYYARVGNASLLPEKARQFNLGVTWSRGSVALTADMYYNSVRDKIIAVPTMFIWKMRNLGKVRMIGTDLTAAYSAVFSGGTSLQFRANYSYCYAVDVTDPDAKNYRHQIQYTPRHSGNAVVSLQTRWIDASYALNVIGSRYSLPQNIAANEMPAYFDHSISISRSFDIYGAVLRLSAEALNLTDVNYEVVRYYPMPGRNFRLTMKVTY